MADSHPRASRAKLGAAGAALAALARRRAARCHARRSQGCRVGGRARCVPWTKNRHAFKFGVERRRDLVTYIDMRSLNGELNFPDGRYTGFGVGDFLLGLSSMPAPDPVPPAGPLRRRLADLRAGRVARARQPDRQLRRALRVLHADARSQQPADQHRPGHRRDRHRERRQRPRSRADRPGHNDFAPRVGVVVEPGRRAGRARRLRHLLPADRSLRQREPARAQPAAAGRRGDHRQLRRRAAGVHVQRRASRRSSPRPSTRRWCSGASRTRIRRRRSSISSASARSSRSGRTWWRRSSTSATARATAGGCAT